MTRFVSKSLLLSAALIASLATFGCGPRIETIAIPERTAVTEARQLFEGYVAGNPPSSEVDSYPALVERVKAEDAAAGAVVASALDKIKANRAGAKATATQALKDLDKAAPAGAPATP